MRKLLITKQRGGLWARLTVFMVVLMMTTMQINAQTTYDYTLVLKDDVAHKNTIDGEEVNTSEMGLTYASGVWTMHNFSFATTAYYAVKVKGKTTIKVSGNNNSITSGNLTEAEASSYGLTFWDDCVLTSDNEGTLTITAGSTGNDDGSCSSALTTIKCLTISGNVKVNAAGGTSPLSTGLALAAVDPETEDKANASLVVNGSARVTATSAESKMSVALMAYGPVTVSDNAVMVCTSTSLGYGHMGFEVNGVAKKTGTETVLPFDSDNGMYFEGEVPATDITFSPVRVCRNTTTNVEYGTVQAAINEAGNGQTVQMLANSTENVTVASGKTVTLDLNGFVLNQSTDSNGVIVSSGNLTIKDSDASKIHYFTYSTGAWTYLPDHTPAATDVALADIGTATLTSGETVISVPGGCITGGKATDYGGGVRVNGGSVTLQSGNIIGNSVPKGTSEWKGGGVCVCVYSGTFNMQGGVIAGNNAYTGGGVQIMGTLNMTGGKIIANSAGLGGGVNNDGTITMTGGEIAYNSGGCGGVRGFGTKTVGGTARIINNKDGGNTSNFVVCSGTITVSSSTPLTNGANIGVTAGTPTVGNPVAVTGTNTADYSQYFTSDIGYKVINDGNVVKLSFEGYSVFDVYRDGTFVNGCSSLSAARNAVAYGETGNWTIVVNKDYTCTEYNVDINFGESKPLTINTNGKTITAKQNRRIFVVSNGSVMTLSGTGTFEGNGAVTSQYDGYCWASGAFAVVGNENSPAKKLVLDGPTLKNFKTAHHGGAICITQGSAFEMKSGMITGCVSNSMGGGAIGIEGQPGNTFTMTGGTISGNTANDAGGYGGGAICSHNASCVKMYLYGGEITNNVSNTTGAGINGNATITVGGTFSIHDNVDAATKGDLYLPDNVVIAVSSTEPFAEGANIGILTKTTPAEFAPVAITSNGSVEDTLYFKSNRVGILKNYKTDHIELAVPVCELYNGDTKLGTYLTVQDAVNKISGEGTFTVKMIAGSQENVTIPEGMTLALNLNGKVLKGTDSETVITNNGTLTLTDAVGGGNVTGGAKGVEQNGTLTVGGMLNITGNTANIYLPEGKDITVSTATPLATGANIGVTMATTPTIGSPLAVTGNNSASIKQYFTSDNENFFMIEDDNHVVQLAVTVAQIGDGEKYTTVQAAISAAENNQTVKMFANTTENLTVESGKTITLDLNGKVLKGDGTISVVTVQSNANLTLADSDSEAVHYFTAGNEKWTLNTTATTGTAYASLTARPAAGTVIAVKGGCITGGGGTEGYLSLGYGGGVYVSGNSGVFTMNGGNIVGNHPGKFGGGVSVGVEFTGTININGGRVIGNQAGEGSGVHGHSNSIIVINGGDIAFNYGRGAVKPYGNLTMNDGNVRYNKGPRGAGMDIEEGNVAILGGSITDNETTENAGGGIFFADRTFAQNPSSLTFGGTAKVTGNKHGSDNRNLYMKSSFAVNVSTTTPLASGANIGVTLETGIGNVTSATDVANTKYFISDNKDYTAFYREGVVTIDSMSGNVFVIETGQTYETVQAAVNAATAGQTVRLLKNTDIEDVLDIVNGKNFTLDLNGYMLNQTAENKRVMNVNSGATITITDSHPDRETHYFKVGTVVIQGYTVDRWILDTDATSGTDWKALTARPKTNDIIAVKGGIITGGYAYGSSDGEKHGGAIYNGGTVNINAGTIVGNTAIDAGGGIFTSSGTILICGTAALVGNSANIGGASSHGTNSWSTGTFTMTDDSRISFNSTRAEGGGIFIRLKTEISGNSEISYNKTLWGHYGFGGGVSIFSDNANVTISDNVLIANNYSAAHGGGISYRANNTLSITGATIINNGCGNQGGGVYCGDVKMTIGGTTIITGNKKENADNNLYLPTGKVVTASSLTEGANIGITSENVPTIGNPVAVTGDNSESVMQYFTSDNGSLFVIEADNKAVQLAVPVAQIVGGEKFTSVQAAINAAEDGQTVQMLNTTTESVTFTEDKAITLDLNGKTLSSSSEDVITVSSGTLTITDNTGDNGGVTGDIFLNGGETTINHGKYNGTITKSGEGTTLNLIGGKYSFDPTQFLDITYVAKPTGEEPYKYEVMEGRDLIVCTDGTHSFTTLQHAIEFQTEETTITLSKDITENLEIADGKNIILDLKGKIITSNGGGTTITNAGILTVIDSSEGQTGKITGATGTGNYGIENNGTLNLNAGEISGNANGVNQNGDMTVGGTVKINGNTTNNLYLPEGNTVAVSDEPALKEGANIHVTTEAEVSVNKPVNITSNGKDTDMQYFHSDDEKFSVIYENNDDAAPVVKLAIPVCKVGEGESAVYYSSIEKAVEHATGATTVKMTQNSTENLKIADGKDITLDLNGKTLTAQNTPEIVITNNGTLTVIDSSDGNGIITGATTGKGKGIANYGTLNLYAGYITGNNYGVANYNTLTVGGKAVIEGNGTTTGGNRNLTLPNGKIFSIATGDYAPAKTMRIGITTQTAPTANNDIPLTDANEKYLAYSTHFFGDNSAYTVFYNDTDKKLYLTNDVTIIVTAAPDEGGEAQLLVTATGEPVEDPEHILYNTSVTIKAIPTKDWAFKGWFYKGTNELFCKTQTYTFNATTPKLELEARFTDQVIWVRVKKGN